MTTSSVAVYAASDSPRLRYVLHWLLTEQLGLDYYLLHDPPIAGSHRYCLVYGMARELCVSIPDAGLLWQEGITPPVIPAGAWSDMPVLYGCNDPDYTLPFDLFSAIFFLLSRYEEYYSFTPDKHGRYPATESILYKSNLLERPVIDEWVHRFRLLLEQQWRLTLKPAQFSFQPTYDIDIAWSYLHKGWERGLGAASRDLMRFDFRKVLERIRVITGRTPDPYDAFPWLKTQHSRHHLKPLYFILAASATSLFDKNIDPAHPAMQELIWQLGSGMSLHPSYYSDVKPGLLEQEKERLAALSGAPITRSRQHYIKLRFPGTYHRLIEAGITDDYSMGYSTHLGFRAGTGQSFYWYDLSNEIQTALRIHSFCFMDTTAHFDMQLPTEESFYRLGQMRGLLQETRSTLTTIFHNFSLGSDFEWKGWREAYAHFLEEQDNTATS